MLFGCRRLLCAIAFIMCAVSSCHAATNNAPFLLNGPGPGTVAMDGPWEFRTGDDMAWASPTFDDSGWENIDVSRPWGDQGHWDFAGHAWYRRRIEFDPSVYGAQQLALFVPETGCAYEVYWNGRKIGSTDNMPTLTVLKQSTIQAFPLGPAERGVLAFRVSTTPLDSTTAGNALGLNTVPIIGTTKAIGNLAAKEEATILRRKLLLIAQIIIDAQLSFLALLAWWRNRTQKLLIWAFAFLLSSAVWVYLDPSLSPWMLKTSLATALDCPSFHAFVDVALWYLLLYLLELNQSPKLVRWTRLLAWVAILSAIGDDLSFFMPGRDEHVVLFQVLDAVFTFGFSAPAIFPLILIALAFQKRMDPARRLVAITAFCADMYFVIAHTAQQGERYTHWTLYDRMTSPLCTVAGVEVSIPTLLSFLLSGSVVYAVYRYTLEQDDRQKTLEQEFHNARAVQQVLIPEDTLQVPGFEIHSVYKPFGEVGGDFFQIVPMKGGGMIAVIGDVSGKGMPAAMTVALLVGTVRTLAYYTQSPGTILAAMNLRMLGRSQGGFTTCLVMRLDVDGRVTLANAGHIAPYRNGHEIDVEAGLPLGIVGGSTYPEASFQLGFGEQLTLLTDGVAEARNGHGQLLGFDRTAELSKKPAETIAATAQRFGQDDDITVLTLKRLRLEELNSAARHATAMSPA